MPRRSGAGIEERLEELRLRVIALQQRLEDAPAPEAARLLALEDALGEVRVAVRGLATQVAGLRAKVEPRTPLPRIPAGLVREFLDTVPPDALGRGLEYPPFGDRRIADDAAGPARRYLAAVLPEIVADVSERVLQQFAKWVNGRPPRRRRAR